MRAVWLLLLVGASCGEAVEPTPLPAVPLADTSPIEPPPQVAPTVAPEVPGEDIADIREIPQSLQALAAKAPDSLWVSDTLVHHAQTLRARFYAPWSRKRTGHTAIHLSAVFARYGKRTLWGQDLRPRMPGWVEGLLENAQLAAFPNVERRGVTVRHVAVRFLPSSQPGFEDPSKPGEGFPFDYLQASLLQAGTPVYIVHQSKDGAWFFVESHLVNGWVLSQDIAFADAAFVAKYHTETLQVMLADGVPLWDVHGLHRGLTRVGQRLPQSKDGMSVLVPARDAVGLAVATAVPTPELSHSIPMAGDAPSMAIIGDRLLGQAYGWGGTLEDRDCSATLADLFTTVGIALPRHSGNQAKVGTWVDLTGLEGAAKEAAIVAEGIPFATLIWKPGHIMLYVGVSDDGRPLVFHTMWGVKTRAPGADALGRKVVGRTVITTLEPGRERADFDATQSLLHGTRGMTLLAARPLPVQAMETLPATQIGP
ncbi:MAG: cell wall-associated NlpC family hydrolase [Myxococcota bacterium]|jgi:cell wall-associated NlpC family hydrolase